MPSLEQQLEHVLKQSSLQQEQIGWEKGIQIVQGDEAADEWMYEEAECNDEELVEYEDVDEQTLLQMMEEQENSLDIVKRLFHTRPDQVNHLQCLSTEQLAHFYETGLVIVDDFCMESIWDEARQTAMQYYQDNQMTLASTVRQEDDPFRDRQARDDWITWLHDEDLITGAHSAFHPILMLFHKIRSDLSHCMHLHSTSEYQVAYYPGSGQARYERHRDAFPIDDPQDQEQRRVTVICYLNPSDWQEQDGGSLRIHRTGLEQDIVAQRGRIVMFMSGVVDHEVLPSFRDRFAITSWIK